MTISPSKRLWLAIWLLGVVAFGGAAWWWLQGRPVTVVPAPRGPIECVSYTPFRRAGESPYDSGARVSPRQIDTDLRLLSQHVGCVRTYAQGRGLDAVPRIARRYHMKVLLGIWLSADRVANRREIARGIATARANRDVVRAVVVGNEVLLRGELPPARLAADLRQVHAATGLPVTYADVWSYWLRYAHRGGLADAASFVTIHVLPYWEDQPVSVSHALVHLQHVLQKVHEALPAKHILIGETGWPSAGKSRKGAVPSRVNEARYVRTFLRYAAEHRLDYNLIEAFDQPWKRRLEGTVGGYWGLYDAAGRAKFALRGPVVEIRRWWLGPLAALGLAGLFALTIGGDMRRRGLAALAGFAAGAALAAAARQMWLALSGPWTWSVATAAWLLAVWTAWRLTRSVLASPVAPRVLMRLRLAWLFAAAYIDLLLVFDGRYRDYPSTWLAVPALALFLHRLWQGRSLDGGGSAEQRLLSAWLVVASVWLLVGGSGLDIAVCAWGGVNLVLAASTPWRGAAHEAAAKGQAAG